MLRLASALLGIIVASTATLAQAQPARYPSRTIEIVVAYGPGGSTDADLILMRDGLNQLCGTLGAAIDALATFAQTWKDEPTLGFTHFQPAQLTTVGKRATLWLFDFVLDLQRPRGEIIWARHADGTPTTGMGPCGPFSSIRECR